MSNATHGSSTRSDRERGNESYLLLLWTMLRMNILLMIRYKVNFMLQLVGMYLFFALIFFGGQEAVRSTGAGGVSSLGSTLDAVIVGWFLWTMAQSAYSSLSGVVTQESRWGTLEQLYMSPHGFGRIMSTKIVVNLVLSLIMGSIMLALMLLTSGRTLAIDVVTVLPIVVLTLMSVLGIGFVFGGLALIYKKISSVSSLMQIALIGLVAAPAAEMFVLRFLPLVQGSSMLQAAMRDGVRIWEFEPTSLGILVGTGVVYTSVGYLVFRVCSQIARKRGVMGHY
mgnify:CR=1 FL=1